MGSVGGPGERAGIFGMPEMNWDLRGASGPARHYHPLVKSVSPTPDATGVSPAVNGLATFFEKMKAATIDANTVTLRKTGTTRLVAAHVNYDKATNRAKLDPNTDLGPGTKYVGTVTSGARDLAGNALDQDKTKAGNQQKTWKFTVE